MRRIAPVKEAGQSERGRLVRASKVMPGDTRTSRPRYDCPAHEPRVSHRMCRQVLDCGDEVCEVTALGRVWWKVTSSKSKLSVPSKSGNSAGSVAALQKLAPSRTGPECAKRLGMRQPFGAFNKSHHSSRGGHRNNERRSFSRLTLAPHFAMHSFDHPFDNRQSQASGVFSAGRLRAQARELAEKLFLIFSAQPGTFILHFAAGRARLLFQSYKNVFPWRRVLHGVGNQVL